MNSRLVRFAALLVLIFVAKNTLAAGGSCGSIAVPSGVTNCFFISKSIGNDGNTGTSEQSPWAHLPGMLSCTGTCAASTPVPGAGYILRGGDTWTSSDLGVYWQWSGTATAPIYIGVDPNWYAGKSWSRPVWNCGQVSCGNYSKDHTTYYFEIFPPNRYVTIDNIEMAGIYNANGSGGFFTVYNDHVEVKNSYFHGWAHGTNISNNFDVYSCSTNNGGSCAGSLFHDNIIDGSDTSKDSMYGTYGGDTEQIYNNYYRYLVGALVGSSNFVHDNTVEYPVYSFAGDHANGIFNFSPASGTYTLMYNNVVRHTTACSGCVNLWINGLGTVGNGNLVSYFFNNVEYDLNASNVLNMADHPNGYYGTYYIFNNTIECGNDSSYGACQGTLTGPYITGYFTNNYWISPGEYTCTTNSTCTFTTELPQTISQAKAAGYTSSQNYVFSPTASNSPTVGKGTNIQSYCIAIASISNAAGIACQYDATFGVGYDTINHKVVSPNRAPLARPQSGPWDIGAYQFSSAQAQIPQAPTSLQAVVQ